MVKGTGNILQNKQKLVILITAKFPYVPGEEFLETEIKYWKNYCDSQNIEMTIMPLNSSAIIRELPKGIELHLPLVGTTKNKLIKHLYIIAVFFKILFYREIMSQNIYNPRKIKKAVRAVRDIMFYKKILSDIIKYNLEKDLFFYTYWYDEVTYALQLLKEQYNFKLITRTHGHDLYEERMETGYMPMRRMFIKQIDRVFTITESANQYLSSTYGYPPKLLTTARLGVDDLNIICSPSLDGEYHIASCSSIIKVKRIDKIIDAILQLSLIEPDVLIYWTHIGAGHMEDEIQDLAKSKLIQGNTNFRFLGQLDNKQVFNFYKKNKVDVFLNVSEFEGVPVSIMEAISCRIPIIAPDVGGIRDMVRNKFNGKLIDSECTVEEITVALKNISFFKDQEIRNNGHELFEKYYDAKKNYPDWINNIILNT